MSEKNVEIVKATLPPTGTDLTAFFADTTETADRLVAAEALFDPEFEFESHGTRPIAHLDTGLPAI